MKIPSIEKAPLLPIAICLVAGILTGFNIDASISYPFLVVMAVLAFFLRKKTVAHTLTIVVATMLLGMVIAQREHRISHGYGYDGHERMCNVIITSELVEKHKTVAVDAVNVENGQRLKCYVHKDSFSMKLMPGNGLRIRACIEGLSDDEKASDYDRYLLRQGYAGRCFVKAKHWEYSNLKLDKLSVVTRAQIRFLQWRHQLLERYRMADVSGDAYAVVAAMTLGDKTMLNDDLRDTYSISGASHVLALSGMHLGIICCLLMMLTMSRWHPRVLSQLLLVIGIWGFAFLVGLPTSVVRSALMISIFAVFSLGYRTHMSVNLLCLAAVIILLCSPYAVYDVGFQLSFAAVMSIVVLMPMFFVERNPSFFVGCMGVSLAAQVGVAPIIAYHFGRFSTYFLLTNLVVVPAAYAIICGAFLTLLFPPLSIVLVWTVNTLNTILTMITRMPLASIEGLHPSMVQVALYYVFVAVMLAAYLIWKGYYPKSVNRWYKSS